jgi:hypothetical protein
MKASAMDGPNALAQQLEDKLAIPLRDIRAAAVAGLAVPAVVPSRTATILRRSITLKAAMEVLLVTTHFFIFFFFLSC